MQEVSAASVTQSPRRGRKKRQQWRAEGCGTVAELIAAFDACLEQVGPALAGHWTAP
jgi:hypothetical protein